ncbi:NAD-dependent epimerase/dehydratase family protein [Atopobacter sp. AH10]|uniref:polysaccharide biosynthesis C-terminal domain-containing protein n=1 Tax=Atopobacter sp. AH10 TaxID=2315861 RepID=UPI000EF26C8F|nr:NAD-dependent epimerase/dehydratase family protein [Atopobacter sp. AH10]RLK63788.1 NAD-dependent epimerase/dehydratase family protein [Atopobacter sp. AH10]
MKVLVTGAQGFIGKNLCASLNYEEAIEILPYTEDSSFEDLKTYTAEADFVFHLAGVNRPKEEKEFTEGNRDLTQQVLDLLVEQNNLVPVLITSSSQAKLDNPYGKSKKAAEELVFQYGNDHHVPVYVYRLSNVFGKWSRPNYNTVVATFCHNIARNQAITVNDPKVTLDLIYIDDLVEEFMRALNGKPTKEGDFCKVPVSYPVTLGQIAELLYSFKESRNNRILPNFADEFTNKLYATYLSFLDEQDFSYPLIMHEDQRGSFTEFVKSPYGGQVSVNVSKPGITKGDHWHHTKNEKFLVVSGEGAIRFRKLDSDKIIEYKVSGRKMEVVDIPTGYTHSIVNLSDTEDLVTVMWVNEMYDPNRPDTYPLEVE